MVQIVDSAGVFVPVARLSLTRPAATPAAAPDRPAPGAPGAPSAPAPAAPAAAPPAPAPVLPSQTLFVELAEGAVLRPGTKYRITVRGARNLVGLVGDSGTDLTVPAAAPAGNTTRG
jgi:hypothetical protein